MGQVLLNHLGGGEGGMAHFLDQFTGPITAWWKALGSPELTPELRQKLIDGVHAEVGSRSAICSSALIQSVLGFRRRALSSHLTANAWGEAMAESALS